MHKLFKVILKWKSSVWMDIYPQVIVYEYNHLLGEGWNCNYFLHF